MDNYIWAHQFCTNNRKQLEHDSTCGCFYCGKIFHPVEIIDWIPEKNGTAICPYCGIDAVIGGNSGFSITDAFLAEMNRYWFGKK